jgi:hypothetical protein
MELRKQFLRGYIFALSEEGKIKLSDGIGAIDKFILCAASDAWEILKEHAAPVARDFIQRGANKLAAQMDDPTVGAAIQFGSAKLASIIEKEGLSGLWERLKVHLPPPPKKTGDQGLDSLVRLQRGHRK